MVLTEGEVIAVLDHQTSVMEQLAAGAELGDVLDSVVRALEELMGGSRCSVLVLDADGRLRRGSAPTLPVEYSAAIDGDRKSTRLNSSHIPLSRMPSSA